MVLSFLLYEELPGSYTCLGSFIADLPVGNLEKIALERFKSYLNVQNLRLFTVPEPEIYRCRESLRGESLMERQDQAACAANSGQLHMEGFSPLREGGPINENDDIIIVLKATLHLNFLMFEQTSTHPYVEFGSGSVVVFPEDSTQVIYDAARSEITHSPPDEGPETIVMIDSLVLYELNEEGYKKAKEGKLEPGILKRGSCVILRAEDKFRKLTTTNLIFVFAVTRKPPKRQLNIPYVMFYRENKSYQFAGANYVDASSEDTVKFVQEAARERIMRIPPYDTETRPYEIRVYEPREKFKLAYDKKPIDLESLKLEEKFLSGANCVVLVPQDRLSRWRVGQTLIIVFGTPVQPQPSLVSTGMVDGFNKLSIADMPPSTVGRIEIYSSIQKDEEKRILDDRPKKDDLIAPISLLFQPFGYFHDIRCGLQVPGEKWIRENELRAKVDELADEMALFHNSEEDRLSKFIGGLEDIFGLTPGSITPSKTPGRQAMSGGHVVGMHGAIIFCVECKNELSAASCEPTPQLFSYIAASLKSRVNDCKELFQRWRVPALGAIHVGPYLQFFGVVWVGQMRVVPLTPLLPMVNPTGEQFRWDLFLAFKAASFVFSEIRTHIANICQVLKTPAENWPPAIATMKARFPSITAADTFPNPTAVKLKFSLMSRYGTAENRHLYLARLISPSSDKAVYVKFSQRYSVKLHNFCASRGLAPKILGFEQLRGGWFVVVMEKIDTIDCQRIASFSEAGEWKEHIKELVDGFHEEGLVHGDIRLVNFVFTESENPRKMLLVDFDWGGEVGEVEFPHELLTEELGVSNDQLHGRLITKEHDLRCLSHVFWWLNTHTR